MSFFQLKCRRHGGGAASALFHILMILQVLQKNSLNLSSKNMFNPTLILIPPTLEQLYNNLQAKTLSTY
jgi:hypothetical protein